MAPSTGQGEPGNAPTSLSVLVIGATGHGGSYLCLELVNRGHRVTGLSRKPSTLGQHRLYNPKVFDVVGAPFLDLVEEFKGDYDVVVKYGTATIEYGVGYAAADGGTACLALILLAKRR